MSDGAARAAGGVRSFADLHVHTSASFDSLSPLAAVLRAAARRGLSHVAITDHGTVEAALRAQDDVPEELSMIVGQEVRTSAGDMIGLYLRERVPEGLSPAETAAAIHEQGGLAGLPHPFDRYRGSGAWGRSVDELAQLASLVDYVEGWNARVMLGNGNVLAAEFAHQHGLPAVASSDAHTVMEVAVAYTILHGPLDSAEQMRAALPFAQLVTGRASRLIRAGMPLAKLIQRLRGVRRTSAA
ncbi:MAG TPA: PHP-associated domain-containing protein [Candidatus Limnocylindria bacterium]|nr:PHP-associated domain-containing protein [Candidatus Limnocylindria bacterium]